MSLDKLTEKVYVEGEGDPVVRKHSESEYDPFAKKNFDPSVLNKEKIWIKEEGDFPKKKKRALKIIAFSAAGMFLLAGLVVAFVKYKQSAFSEKKVTIIIEGGDISETTGPMRYVIKYKNDNRVDLNGGEIILNYSENFQPEVSESFEINNATSGKFRIGTLKAFSEGEVKVSGSFYAPRDFTAYINATFNYTPTNISSVFQAKTQKGILVKTSPIALDVVAPLDAANGDKVEYVIDYKNFSDRYLDNLRLKADYPSGFTFSSSDPAPSEGDNFWYLGALRMNESGKIRIRGFVRGENKDSRIIRASVGTADDKGEFVVYTTKEKTTRVIASPLKITQVVNGLQPSNVNAGEDLNYILEFSNNGDIGLRDVIVNLEIDSPVLDFSRLKLKTGYYDAKKKTIYWKASEVPALEILAPGQSGRIEFSIPVLERIPLQTENDKNFIITSIAKIDSPDVQTQIGSNKIIASDRVEMKLNSKIVFESAVNYDDQFILNSGQNPPKVGEETTYTAVWKISNLSNDVSSVKVVSSMPSGIKWKGNVYPKDGDLEYNERTNQLIWNVGNLNVGAGVLTDKKEIRFQIGFMPQVNSLDFRQILLGSSTLTAKDNFTGQDLRVESKEVFAEKALE